MTRAGKMLFLFGVLCWGLLSSFHSLGGSAENDLQIKVAGKGPMEGGIYRAPLLNNPKTLDPAFAEDVYSIAVIQQIFDGLVQFSPDLFVVPALAESWQVEGRGTVYRFILRENGTFHNGTRVTATDVIFSLSRLMRLSPPPLILPSLLKIVGARDYRDLKADHVSGLRAEGDHILLVTLEEPYVPFLIALGMYQSKIVPSREVLKEGAEFGMKPVGSGPFRMVSWQANQKIQLERYPDYHGGQARLDGISFLIYPGGEIESVYNAFIKGELHEMPVYGQIRERLKGHGELKRVHRPSLSLLFYGVNCRHPVLGNPDIRRALSLAIDRERLVKTVYDNQFEPARSILPPGLPGYQPDVDRKMYDLEEAITLFKRAAGNTSPALDTIEVVSNVQSVMAQSELSFVRDAWAKLGIALVPKFIPDWSRFEEYLKSESLQVYRYAWYADMPDPDNFLQPLFGTGAVANFMRFKNDRVDEMLQAARAIADPLERAGMYHDLQKAIHESVPVLPLFYLSIDMAYQPYVQGIQVNALGGAMPYQKIWLSSPEG